MSRLFWRLLIFLALGLVTTVGLAWGLNVLVEVQQGRQTQAESFVDDERWTVTRWDRAGAVQIRSVRIRGLDWSPQQAAGAPDTRALGDQVTAWASQQSDGGTEWLVLDYDKAVIPREVDVYESCAPGALFRVTVFDESGKEIEAWSGADPTPPSSSSGPVPVSKVPISLNVPTRRIKLYLACDKVPGWNEIDAVGLVSDRGEQQWARHVTASTTYASHSAAQSGASGNPALLAPAWSGLATPGKALQSGSANREERAMDARGWPLLALSSEVDLLGPAAAAAAANANSRKALGGTTLSGYQVVPMGGAVSGMVAVTSPGATTDIRPPLPTRPIPIGLFIDSVLFGLAWLAIWLGLTVPRQFVREVARLRRGACVECGYDLGYNFIGGCPECGWRRRRGDH
ncbi:MAG TPA: hypothetical protein VH475_28720 [Tepidisphaeraceae bacterium]